MRSTSLHEGPRARDRFDPFAEALSRAADHNHSHARVFRQIEQPCPVVEAKAARPVEVRQYADAVVGRSAATVRNEHESKNVSFARSF